MTVPIRVDNRIRIPLRALHVDVTSALKSEFTHKNPQYATNEHLGLPTWNLPQRFLTFFEPEDGSEISFPRGGLERIRKILTEFDLDWEIEDLRTEGAPDVRPEDIPDHLLTPYDYQEEFIEIAIEREQCLLKAPTGSGKTVIIFAIIARIKLPSLIILPNGGIYRQWKKRVAIELGLSPRDIGEIKGPKSKLRPITLVMPQTLSKRLENGGGQDIRDYFGAVFADEAQQFAANTFYSSVDPMPARYRIAVSADHTRKDRKEFLVYDLFGDVAKQMRRSTLEKKGAIVPVEIWVVPTDFRADWYGVPEETEESAENVEDGDEKKKLDFNKLLNEMLQDDDRNALAYNIIVKGIVEKGEQAIAFAARREHVLMIDRTLAAQRIRTGFLLGTQENAKEFEKTLRGLTDRTLDVGVGTYQAGGTGIDLPHIANGVAMTPIGGNKQFFGQVRGRFARTIKDGSGVKEKGKLFYLWDRHVYPSHLRNLMKWNKDVFVWTGTSWMEARHYIESRKDVFDAKT